MHGIVEFLGIKTVMFVPDVSIPNDNGQTSKRRISPAPADYVSSFDNTAAYTAAPSATASSGLSYLSGSLPLK